MIGAEISQKRQIRRDLSGHPLPFFQKAEKSEAVLRVPGSGQPGDTTPVRAVLSHPGGASDRRGGGRWGARSSAPISLPCKEMHERESSGFTLIEMMVVMAIIALMAAMAIPSISSYFNVSLSATGREIAGTVKETYNATVVTGQVHRIVYDLKEGQYWVESGPPTVMLDTEASKKREERKKRLAISDDKPKDDTGGWAMDKSVTRKKQSLPTGVKFEDVKTAQSDDPITEGKAYTHFFPHGLIESTIVHLMDTSKHHVSLVFQPIIGKTDMYDHYVNEKEAYNAGK
jgi:prepilin-type N-terminal cleavage/methylation domain-containing protein